MKKLAILFAIALELAVCGCGNNTPTSTITTTSTDSSWEAQLNGGSGQASLLNFVVIFSANTTGPLDVTGFAFFNQGACFDTTTNTTTESGSATLTTGSAGTVTGNFTLTIKSNTNGSVLTLGTPNPATLTGRSNGTTTTIGTLSNGVVIGNWSLVPGSNATGCNSGAGNFVMCQGAATCSITPTAAAADIEKL
jgi:hypothetical protein